MAKAYKQVHVDLMSVKELWRRMQCLKELTFFINLKATCQVLQYIEIRHCNSWSWLLETLLIVNAFQFI